MSPLTSSAVALRRLLAKRPWIYWLVVAAVAIGAAASMLRRADAVDAERDAWGDTVTVLVAERDHAVGEPLSVDRRDVPVAVAPEGRTTDVEGRMTRQRIGAGEIITEADIVASEGPQTLIPDGWRGVPIIESPASGASVGDRVDIVSDGVVISVGAVVVGHHDDVTIVAVPADVSAAVPAAADARSLTLLLRP